MIIVGQTSKWEMYNGLIGFEVTSDGSSGEDWMTRFEQSGSHVGEWAERTLLSPNFEPTNGVTTRIRILNENLFAPKDRVIQTIAKGAGERGLVRPHLETACLIREMFTDDEIVDMGLGMILVISEPVVVERAGPQILCVSAAGKNSHLGAYHANSRNVLPPYKYGFALALAR